MKKTVPKKPIRKRLATFYALKADLEESGSFPNELRRYNHRIRRLERLLNN